MNASTRLYLFSALAIASVLAWSLDADAVAGRAAGGGHAGGGARPSIGNVGGGGGRPSGGNAGANCAAPHPQPSRPNVSHPSMGNAAKPSIAAARPAIGNFSPSGGERPHVSRPAANPGGAAAANRPSLPQLNNVLPTNRPSLPNGENAIANRPHLNDRPGGDRPSLGNINRPTTLPELGGRPGIGGDRPNIGGDRPGAGERLPGLDRPGDRVRPGAGGRGERLPAVDRPGDRLRPGAGGEGERFPGHDRPIIGGGSRPDRPNRPIIGNGNHINNGNINIGNRVNIGGNHVTIGGGNVIGNHPNWDRPNWNNPNWGWGGGGGWAGNWHNHCINGHYGWYNGCWNGGYWGSSWYRPLPWIAVGWGLGSLTSGWGYGTSYYNPYYVQPAVATTVAYDYSQPVVVNNYAPADADAGNTTQPTFTETPATDQATQLFDDGLALFKTGDYRSALTKFDAALRQLPGDPVVHEVRALTLFALGDYKSAAAALNSFLSSAPGMDWTTMSGLYGNADDYTTQYRRLEQYCQANPNDPAAHFVLAYHDLVIGAKDAAIGALKVVVANQPKDATAKRMLDALSPPVEPAPPVATTNIGAAEPQTDLVGSWQAKAGDATIDLAITDDSQFTWKAIQPGRPAIQLKGQLDANGDALALQTADQGSMAGSVKSLGPDQWQFALDGAPPSDPGLKFVRVKN